MLYEMVTGRRAFEGKSQLSVLTSILEKDPEPVSHVQPASPAMLDDLVTTCLQKNPEERFQTAQDVKLPLRWIADSGSKEALAPASLSGMRARLGWIVAGVALTAALALGWSCLKIASRPTSVVRSSILPPAGAAFVTKVPSSGPAVISPDGTRLAFTARDEKGKVLLYVHALNSTTAQALTGTEDSTYPFWSADGREIGFFAQGKLKKVSASGGPVQSLCDAASGRGGAWNKDGVILFTPSTQGALFRVPARGGTPELASKVDAAHSQNSHRWPHFLPDNQHFIFWARTALGGTEEAIHVGSLNSLETKMILEGVTTATYASGYILFTREQTLMAQAFDMQKLELTGEAVPIAEHVALNGATGVPEFSAAENGILVYQTGEAAAAWDLVWYGRDGKLIGPLAQQDRYFAPELSPDGGSLAFTLFNGNLGLGDIWTMDLKRGTRSRLTFGPGAHNSAVWSYDSKLVYYSSNAKGGAFHIYSKASDGSGSEQVVQEDPDASETVICVSLQGRYLVYDRRLVNDAKGNIAIWALPLSGDRKPFPVVQGPFNDRNPSVSPNSKWMAYQSDESGRTEVYITAFPGGGARWQVSTSGGSDARWRGDGNEMYFLDPSDNLMAADVDISSGTPRLGVPHALFQAAGVQRVVGAYTVTRDGKKFVVNSGSIKQGSEPLTLVQNWTAELKK